MGDTGSLFEINVMFTCKLFSLIQLVIDLCGFSCRRCRELVVAAEKLVVKAGEGVYVLVLSVGRSLESLRSSLE